MKIIAALVMVWLLCGIIAGGLVEQTRPATMADVKFGPISLFLALRG